MSKAVDCYNKAAEKGHLKAQLKLGLCHLDGIGITKDEKKGVSLVLKPLIREKQEQWLFWVCVTWKVKAWRKIK